MRPAAAAGVLARQLTASLLGHFALALVAGASLFVGVDAVETGNLADPRAPALDLARLQLWNLPLVAVQLAGLAALVGAVTAVAGAVRRGEAAAAFAAGASPALFLAPALVTGLAVAAGFAAVTEAVTPRAAAEVRTLRRRLGLPSQRAEGTRRRDRWFKGADGFYRVEDLERAGGEVLAGVLILRVEGGRLRERRDIARLTHDGRTWRAAGVVHRVFEPGGEVRTSTAAEATLALTERPEDFVRSVGVPGRLPLGALRATLAARERLGHPATEHRLELHRRAALPVALVLATVLGAGLGLRLGRRPGTGAALAAGAAAGFSLWLLDELAVALATSGAIPAAPAAYLGALALGAAAAGAWLAAFRHGLRR